MKKSYKVIVGKGAKIKLSEKEEVEFTLVKVGDKKK